MALEEAGAKARGSDLVVTLEPCRHHGKTPPCIEAILAHGIRRVVFGAADVDPRARGGALHLRTAGVRVDHGLLAEDVRRQNAAFFHRYKSPLRPFVALKLAVSLDARIADRNRRSQWVTGEDARAFVHWLRAGFEAVAVGVGTVRADDPQLTAARRGAAAGAADARGLRPARRDPARRRAGAHRAVAPDAGARRSGGAGRRRWTD